MVVDLPAVWATRGALVPIAPVGLLDLRRTAIPLALSPAQATLISTSFFYCHYGFLGSDT
jgi:hypothetical protein